MGHHAGICFGTGDTWQRPFWSPLSPELHLWAAPSSSVHLALLHPAPQGALYDIGWLFPDTFPGASMGRRVITAQSWSLLGLMTPIPAPSQGMQVFGPGLDGRDYVVAQSVRPLPPRTTLSPGSLPPNSFLHGMSRSRWPEMAQPFPGSKGNSRLKTHSLAKHLLAEGSIPEPQAQPPCLARDSKFCLCPWVHSLPCQQ